jgi:hypothetical protein
MSRSSAGMTCGINVRRSFLAFYSALSKSPRIYHPSRSLASHTCRRLTTETFETFVQTPKLCFFGVFPHSICIRDVKESFSVRPRFPGSFEYLVLDVQDSEEQNLIRLFPRFGWHVIAVICTDLYITDRSRAQQFINTALSRSGRVLVHCNGTILPVISSALDLKPEWSP